MASPSPKSVLPLTHAHQLLLQAQIAELEAGGQDVTLLNQLARSLPNLRAGLSQSERQRLEALDRNETELMAAFDETIEGLQAYEWTKGVAVAPALLIDIGRLDQIAEAAQRLAEVVSELALRSRARRHLLIGESA